MTNAAEGPPTVPDGLAERGAALWAATVSGFVLSPTENVVLAELCHAVDLLDRLQTALAAGDIVTPWGEGVRLHPLVPEIRAQRVTVARLVAALDLPTAEAGDAVGDDEHLSNVSPPGRLRAL